MRRRELAELSLYSWEARTRCAHQKVWEHQRRDLHSYGVECMSNTSWQGKGLMGLSRHGVEIAQVLRGRSNTSWQGSCIDIQFLRSGNKSFSHFHIRERGVEAQQDAHQWGGEGPANISKCPFMTVIMPPTSTVATVSPVRGACKGLSQGHSLTPELRQYIFNICKTLSVNALILPEYGFIFSNSEFSETFCARG